MDTDALRVTALRALRTTATGDPRAMIQVARQMQRGGLGREAVDLALEARAQAGDDPEVAVLISEVLSKGVPRWHFNIVRDRARNDAYRAAIRKAVFPGCKVLEIGTGSGLLALMAAEAGAAQVITCEAEPALAHVAELNVAANGYADRVTVINKHSTALNVDVDLGGPADILVSEILADNLLGEDVLHSHADAVSRLLKPGATIIPGGGHIRVALASSPWWQQRVVTQEEGFDLSALNLLHQPHRSLPRGTVDLEQTGAPATLLSFDFATDRIADKSERVDLLSEGGTANGVVQWIALDMIGDQVFENRPGADQWSSWGCRYWPFPDEYDLAPGDSITIGVRTAGNSFWLWPEQRSTRA